MAIKGKSKPKGGAKPVTRGPRPAYVPVRTPLLQRRGLWYAVLAAVLVATAVGVWYEVAQQRETDRERDLQASLRRTMTDYQEQVDPILLTVRHPRSERVRHLPRVRGRVEHLHRRAGHDRRPDSVGRGDGAGAGAAAERLEAIEAAALVAGSRVRR